jgi:hypothetical protein
LAEADAERMPYQELLRIIGQFLDDRQAGDIAIMELKDQFLVRYRTGGDGTVVGVELRGEDLAVESTKREERRKRRGGDPDTRADTLRAIGQELEKLNAYEILLETTTDGYLVSYLFTDPAQDFALHKSMFFLSFDGALAMKTIARENRRLAQFSLFGR